MYSIPKQAPQAPRVLTRAKGKTRQKDFAFPAILDDVEKLSANTPIPRRPNSRAVSRRRSARAGRKTDFRTALKMARTEVELGPWLREFLEAPAAPIAPNMDASMDVNMDANNDRQSTSRSSDQPLVEVDQSRAIPVPVQLATGPQMSLQMKLPGDIDGSEFHNSEFSSGEFRRGAFNPAALSNHAGLS